LGFFFFFCVLGIEFREFIDTPVSPAVRGKRQENYELKTSLGYIARPCLRRKQSLPGFISSYISEMLEIFRALTF
jgi:hypothetical protein